MADLETETPEQTTPEPTPVTETPPAQATQGTASEPPTIEPEDQFGFDAEGVPGAVQYAGKKFIRIGALEESRTKARSYKDQADQLASYVQQVRPYIEFLQAHPDLITKTTQQTQPSPATTTQPADGAAEKLARILDLYTADGQPDVKRAQEVRAFIKGEAKTESDEAIRPLAESTTRERANHNYQRALVTKAPDGRTVDTNTLNAIWQRTHADILATEEGAAGVVAMALGLQVMQGIGGPAPIAPAPLAPPLHTEAPGNRTPNRTPLNTFDQKIASMRGLSDKDYSERTKGFTPGRPNILEDN